uniref:rRNA-processing protein EFG1 n=1 Tax=Panagrellus redivivus TaxID=6233 RepID=A0A7E4UZS4_PANRE
MKRRGPGKTVLSTKKKARKASTPSAVKKLIRLVERLQQGIKDRDAEIAERPTKDDYDRIEAHAAYVREKLQKRDAQIVRLRAKTKNFNRVKKRMQQLELQVFLHNSWMDEYQEECSTQLKSLAKPTDNFGLFRKRFQRYQSMSEKFSKAADAVIDDFDFDTSEGLFESLHEAIFAINSSEYLVESIICELWDSEHELNARIAKIDGFVERLQQEFEVYYANVDDPETFRSQFPEKVQTRLTTIKRLNDEFKCGGDKVPDDADKAEDFVEGTDSDKAEDFDDGTDSDEIDYDEDSYYEHEYEDDDGEDEDSDDGEAEGSDDDDSDDGEAEDSDDDDE